MSEVRCRLTNRIKQEVVNVGKPKTGEISAIISHYDCEGMDARGKAYVSWTPNAGGKPGACYLNAVRVEPEQARGYGFATRALYEELDEMLRRGCDEITGHSVTSAKGYWARIPGGSEERLRLR